MIKEKNHADINMLLSFNMSNWILFSLPEMIAMKNEVPTEQIEEVKIILYSYVSRVCICM